MKHSEAKQGFPDYLRGSLKEKLAKELEEHLHGCESCRKELESVARLDSLLKQEVPAYWKQVEPSPSLMNKLGPSRLEEAEGPPVPRRQGLAWRWAVPLGIALSVLAVLLTVFFVPPVREYVSDIFGVRKVVPPEPTPQVTPGPVEVSAVHGDLTLTLRLSRTTYALGERGVANVSLTNTGQRPIEIAAPQGEYLNLVVQDGQGKEIFNWLLDKYGGSVPTGPEVRLTLKPGASLSRALEFPVSKKGALKVLASRSGDSFTTQSVSIAAVE